MSVNGSHRPGRFPSPARSGRPGRSAVRQARKKKPDLTNLDVDDSVAFRRKVTVEDVRNFVEATGDTNALHLDDRFAEKTRFGRRIVHGTLVSGLISAAFACFPGLTIYLSRELSFERPVDVGETLTARCTIVERLEGERYRMTTRVENEAEEIVPHGTATVLIDEVPDV